MKVVYSLESREVESDSEGEEDKEVREILEEAHTREK